MCSGSKLWAYPALLVCKSTWNTDKARVKDSERKSREMNHNGVLYKCVLQNWITEQHFQKSGSQHLQTTLTKTGRLSWHETHIHLWSRGAEKVHALEVAFGNKQFRSSCLRYLLSIIRAVNKTQAANCKLRICSFTQCVRYWTMKAQFPL